MAEFAAADSYRRFEHTVKHKTRYFHDRQVRTFLDTVLETSQSRKDRSRYSRCIFAHKEDLRGAKRIMESLKMWRLQQLFRPRE